MIAPKIVLTFPTCCISTRLYSYVACHFIMTSISRFSIHLCDHLQKGAIHNIDHKPHFERRTGLHICSRQQAFSDGLGICLWWLLCVLRSRGGCTRSEAPLFHRCPTYCTSWVFFVPIKDRSPCSLPLGAFLSRSRHLEGQDYPGSRRDRWVIKSQSCYMIG